MFVGEGGTGRRVLMFKHCLSWGYWPVFGLTCVFNIFFLQFHIESTGFRGLGLKLFKLKLELIEKSKIVVLLIVCDDLVGEMMAVFQLLLMAATLESIPFFDVVSHLFVEFADPAFFLGPHLILVVVNVGDIFSVLYLAPFSIILSRDILLLLFWSSIVLVTCLEEAGWFEFLILFHI